MKFPKLVIEEATALKKHATKQERDNLDFKTLQPRMSSHCIYGQMTGNCFSDRAVELIQKCVRRVYRDDQGFDIEEITRRQLNGSPKDKSRWSYWSPIEIFIVRYQDKANEKLIQFIKGEIKTL